MYWLSKVSLISNCFFGAGFRVADINRGSVKPQDSTEMRLIFQNNHGLARRLEGEKIFTKPRITLDLYRRGGRK